MDLNVKGSSLADIVAYVETQSTSADQTCQVDFPLFLTIYSVHTGLVYSPTQPRDQPIMWVPTSSGMWIKVSLVTLTVLTSLSWRRPRFSLFAQLVRSPRVTLEAQRTQSSSRSPNSQRFLACSGSHP
jgi:hypothetical protein